MKYELMALVNSIARQENIDGSEVLAKEFDNLYSTLGSMKNEVTPIEVGEDIFDIYRSFILNNFDLKRAAAPSEERTNEYKKPFFVDPDLLEKQAMEQAAKSSTKEYEDFILEMVSLLGIRQPRQAFQQNMRNYMALIKRRVTEIQKENSDNSWIQFPDRMGK